MKQILLILLLSPLLVFPQDITSDLFTPPLNTGANMTLGINSSIFDEFIGGQIGAFYDLDGDGALECVSLQSIQSGFFAMAVWGDDYWSPDYDGLACGIWPYFAVLHNGSVYVVNSNIEFNGIEECHNGYINSFINGELITEEVTCPYTGYCTNELIIISNPYISDIIGCTLSLSENYNTEATLDDGSCIEIDQNENTLSLPSGWSMFGYTCIDSVDAMVGFSDISDKISIVKDEMGLTYLPEWNFNVLGSLQYSEGYQIKMLEEVLDFQFCDAITPEDGITQADLDALAESYEGWCESDIDNDGICDVEEVSGCMDTSSCNYVTAAEFDDTSCEYVSCLDECGVLNGDNSICLDCAGVVNGTSEDFGCGCNNPAVQDGYDCDGIEIVIQIGALVEGGIVFYIDDTGEHGLVAAIEDIGTSERGCWGQEMIGADGTDIGTGYQNTLALTADEYCFTGIAEASLAYEVESYTDWYLPSKDELIEMYNAIGNGSSEGNIGGFQNNWYWSSSTLYGTWIVLFTNGMEHNQFPAELEDLVFCYIRPVRSF